MGYYMSLSRYEFFIPKSKKAAALKAIKALAGKETHRYSGSHYAWVDTKDFTTAKTLEKAVKAWRWYLEVDDKTGDVVGIGFEGEKLGDDDVLFRALGPFVKKGSFIQMSGEDDCAWRWCFNGKTMVEISPTVTWLAF